jgi:hypothetical protein
MRDAVDASSAFDERHQSGRQRRVVLMPRRWHQVREIISRMTVANKPGHRGERAISRNTIVRGMPDVSGVTVVTNARVYYTTRAAADAPSVRHSLRPLTSEGGTSRPNLAQKLRRDRGAMCFLKD